MLADTEHTLRWNPRDSGLTFRVDLPDDPGPGKPPAYTVRGRMHASGRTAGWTVHPLRLAATAVRDALRVLRYPVGT